ncbi:MAG: LuxR C-terminal-related transcriptional regulator [Fibrobacteraceae bacterium]|nr:LuxR C-terminal-related transcriptional regulator [Fibrobacteraceae bacterium]
MTPRQREIFTLLKSGLSNQEICARLCISLDTVKSHLKEIYKALGVNNRMEAVCSCANSSPDGMPYLFIIYEDSVCTDPEASRCFTSFLDSFGKNSFMSLVMPQSSGYESAKPAFSLRFIFSDVQKKVLYVSLHHSLMRPILWSESADLSSPDLDLAGLRLAVNAVLQIQIAASELYVQRPELQKHWWFSTFYAKRVMQSRTKDGFEKALNVLEGARAIVPDQPLLLYFLGLNWYRAVLERWVDSKEASVKMVECASHAMRYAPESQYSLVLSGIANFLTRNVSLTIKNFLKALEINPFNLLAHQFLSQVYTLIGEEKKGLDVLMNLRRIAPQVADTPNNIAGESLLYFMISDFEKCESLCRETLFVMPDHLISRLLLIASLGRQGFIQEGNRQVELLMKIHPTFKPADLMGLLMGIQPEKRRLIVEGVQLSGLKVDIPF